MATEKALILKHYRNLVRNIASFTNGQAYLKVDTDDNQADSIDIVQITIEPSDGPYCGGRFDFELDLSEGYPSCAPTIKCNTQIYHPNVDWFDSEGDVCLNLLDELWTSDMTLEDAVQGLLFLFYNPNVEDPLSSMFTGTESEEDFLENVRKSLRGEEVEGVEFERNLTEGYEWDVVVEDKRKATTNTEDHHTLTQTEAHDKDPAVETLDTQALIESGVEEPTMANLSMTPVPHTATNITHGSIESSVDRDDNRTYPIPQEYILISAISKLWTSMWQYAQEFRIMAMVRTLRNHHTLVTSTSQSALDFR